MQQLRRAGDAPGRVNERQPADPAMPEVRGDDEQALRRDDRDGPAEDPTPAPPTDAERLREIARFNFRHEGDNHREMFDIAHRIEKREATLREIIAIADKAGWNGVENSKILTVFLGGQLTRLEALERLAAATSDERFVAFVQYHYSKEDHYRHDFVGHRMNAEAIDRFAQALKEATP